MSGGAGFIPSFLGQPVKYIRPPVLRDSFLWRRMSTLHGLLFRMGCGRIFFETAERHGLRWWVSKWLVVWTKCVGDVSRTSAITSFLVCNLYCNPWLHFCGEKKIDSRTRVETPGQKIIRNPPLKRGVETSTNPFRKYHEFSNMHRWFKPVA